MPFPDTDRFIYRPLMVRGFPRETAVREDTTKARASPKFSANKKESRATANYWIKWAATWEDEDTDVVQIKKDFLGYSERYVFQDKSVGIKRVIPYPHPKEPNSLYASEIQSLEGDIPVDQDADFVAVYDEFMASVNFATVPFNYPDETPFGLSVSDESQLLTYVTITTNPIARYDRTPNLAGLVWINDNKPADNIGALIRVEAEVDIIWHQIPIEVIPWEAISACVGCCDAPLPNTVIFPFLSSSYVGPVLQTFPAANGFRQISNFVCLAPKFSEPYPMVNGGRAVDINYKFKFYPFGANYFYRWDKGVYEQAVRRGGIIVAGDRGFYKIANFNTLFLGF